MYAIAVHLEPAFLWLLRATAQVCILVGLILLLQLALGRRLGIRERWLLWLILLVGLALPWMAHHIIPAENLPFHSAMKDRVSSLIGHQNPPEPRPLAISDIFPQEEQLARRFDETMVCQPLPWPNPWRLSTPSVCTLALIWLAGTMAFAGCIVAAHLRFRRVVARAHPVTDRKVLALLDDCKRLLGVHAELPVLSTDAIESPALLGYRRPRLLLTGDLLADPDLRQLRHIFLHELAHLKRRDILVGHIASAVHALQWFNPLVALAFRRMRADRELACDALALSVLDPDETRAYGHTVVHQLQRLRATRRLPILAAITGDKAQVKQRIAMIADFEVTRYRRSPLMIALVVSLTCLGLTVRLLGSDALGGAVESAVVTWDIRARRDLPTTHQDKHTCIIRACIRNKLTGKFLTADGERLVCDADEPGDAGLWEVRFDEASNFAESDVYFYSVPARRYLTADKEGNLTVSGLEPELASSWGTVPRPQGFWLISHYVDVGYLRRCDNGQVRSEFWGRDPASYWEVHLVWRIKISDDPKANPQWYREKIPGPD